MGDARGGDGATASNGHDPEAATADGFGPLAGIRVLELGSFIAGPFAGQLLGDYGATVIKIETPGDGDPMRRWGIVQDGEGLWWPSIGRNKQSVAIDLRREEGRALVRRLAASADVVLENFRPGRLVEWQLDYETLSADNPDLIMVHISGYGQSGPRAGDAGFGSIGEGMGGIRHTTGEPDRPSARCGISLGDSIAAMFGVIGTLAAVVERQRSGKGQEIDVALYEAVFALMESTVADYELAGVERRRTGGVLPGVAPSNVYPTADGREVLIAANADSVFSRLCKAMGRHELATDERFEEHEERGRNMAEIDDIIGAWTSTMTTDALLERLEQHGIPSGRIYAAPDMLADPHYAARDMIQRVVNAAGRTVPVSGVVPKFSRTPGGIGHPGPSLGAHTRRVLSELADVDEGTWDELASTGIVVDEQTDSDTEQREDPR